MEDFECKHKILGYSDNPKPITLTENLIEIGSFLEDVFSDDISIKYDLKYDKDLKKDAKKFFKNKLITFHDILLEKPKEVEELIKDYNNKDIKTYEEMLKRIFLSSKKTSAYNIPIELIDTSDFMYGSLYWRLYAMHNKEFLRCIPPIFKHIELSVYKTKLAYITYIHELVHTQVDSVKFNIKNYYNAEIASIFFEKIAALEEDDTLFKICTLERYQSLLGSMDLLLKNKELEEKLTSSTYIISTLTAEKLFDLYLESNTITRNVIMNKIQLLMDGKTTIEEILESLDITFENSCDINILKKHL